MALTARIHPDAPRVIAAAFAAVDGDFSETDKIAAQSIAETELIRREVVKTIGEEGVLMDDDLVMMGKDGPERVGVRRKANPALDHLHELNKTLGHTAPELGLTRKSRGEDTRNQAIAKAFERDQMLRGLDRSLMPGPPPRESATRRRRA